MSGPFPDELTAGQTIAERYRLVALRGTGGMGSVWRAQRVTDGSDVALKVLHRAPPERVSRLAERFIREAKAASSLDSPHVVRVYDYGLDGGMPFIVMELLVGETLASRIQRSNGLSPAETSRIIAQIASGLSGAHAQGIVHRDLKPDNVFLARTSQGTVAKVLDFGVAKMEDEEALARDLTETGALLGTPHYMSPEQVEGARYVDYRADLWSLAVIACECMTATRPFRGDGLRALFAAICVRPMPVPSALGRVPHGFDAWFAKGAHRVVTERFRSAAEQADALRLLCEADLSAIDTEDEAPPTWDTEPASTQSLAEGSSDAPAAVRGSVSSVALPSRRRTLWLSAAATLAVAFAWFSARGLLRTPDTLPTSSGAASLPRPLPSVPRAVVERADPVTGTLQGTQAPSAVPSARGPAGKSTSGRPTRRTRPGTSTRKTEGQPWDVDAMLRDRK